MSERGEIVQGIAILGIGVLAYLALRDIGKGIGDTFGGLNTQFGNINRDLGNIGRGVGEAVQGAANTATPWNESTGHGFNDWGLASGQRPAGQMSYENAIAFSRQGGVRSVSTPSGYFNAGRWGEGVQSIGAGLLPGLVHPPLPAYLTPENYNPQAQSTQNPFRNQAGGYL